MSFAPPGRQVGALLAGLIDQALSGSWHHRSPQLSCSCPGAWRRADHCAAAQLARESLASMESAQSKPGPPPLPASCLERGSQSAWRRPSASQPQLQSRGIAFPGSARGTLVASSASDRPQAAAATAADKGLGSELALPGLKKLAANQSGRAPQRLVGLLGPEAPFLLKLQQLARGARGAKSASKALEHAGKAVPAPRTIAACAATTGLRAR